MLNPIIGMLHNTKDNRWHPIVFEEKPLPGDTPAVRYKSKMHHTTGFKSRDAALENARTECFDAVRNNSFGDDPRFCLEKDFEWDGNDIPAMVVFFVNGQDGKLVPAF